MAITIGIDLGTTTLTAIAVEVPSGRVTAWATAPTPPIDTHQAVTGLLRDGLKLLREVSTKLSRRISEVAGIGITGQQHGVVLIDDRLRPITPLYGWQDRSGDAPHGDGTWASHARHLVGDAPSRTGCRLRSGYGVVTLFTKLPSLPPRFTACTLMDLFGTVLTGLRPVTEATCAASLGALDLRAGTWDLPTLDALRLKCSWFPEVVPDGTQLGGVMEAAEEWTGLIPGTPVVVGVGDNQASFLGSVADPESAALVNVGTGGQVAMYSPTFAIDDQIEARPFFGGGYLLVSAGQTGGAAFAAFSDLFATLLPKRDLYDTLVGHAQKVPPGCDGLRCEPFFRGTRTEPDRRASFTGISDRNFTPGHMARAVLEGMARVLAEGGDRIAGLRGCPPTSLVGSGNGVRANPLLVECLNHAFGMKPRVPAHREEAAFGAALVAAVGVGLLPGFLHAGAAIRYDEPEEDREGEAPAEPCAPGSAGASPSLFRPETFAIRTSTMRTIRNYIGGEFRDAAGWLDDVNPATGEVVARVPDSGDSDVAAAAAAAKKAFPAWSKTPVAERARLLNALAAKIEQHADELARLETEDTGKPLSRARQLEIPRAASNFTFFATAVQHFNAEAYRTDKVGLNYTVNQPRGVAGCISPWNLPLYLFTWKIAPALAVGCTVVAKPSELTPSTAHRLCELAHEVGLPPGVLNVVHGLGAKAGAAIVSHPLITTISFTGGTATGAEVARTAAPLFKKVGLELGGKNPSVVFADADLDEAVAGCVQSAFGNQGQICLCGSRVLVEESIYPKFTEKFVSAARALVVGDPLDPATQQGSLISKTHLDKVRGYVDLATREGGKILCGGTAPTLPDRCKGGYFLAPTVVGGLGPTCRTNQEEIFGPIASLIPFRGERDAIDIANGVEYGLSASLYTQNLGRAHRVAEALECGTVWVNCWLVRDLRVPFGGAKSSGVGREGGDHALHFFADPKTVCVRFADEVPS